MSRHRDVRCMNYSDEYDGYDDVYGHSVEDDYCVSPSAEQFLFDRTKQQNIASFITEPDIVEGDEGDSEESLSTTKRKLSELEMAKLESCMESVRNVIGDAISEFELKNKIIQANFDSEATLDLALKASCPRDVESAAVSRNHGKPFTGKKLPTKGASQGSGVGSGEDDGAGNGQPPIASIKVVPAGTHAAIKGFDLSRVESSEGSMPLSPRTRSPVSLRNSPKVKRKEDKEVGDEQEAQKGKRLLPSPIRNSSVSSPRCRSPMPGSGRGTPESEPKPRLGEDKQEEKVDATTVYKSKRGGGKEQLHLVAVGHVDAGKSTLLGRLLCDLGQVSSKLIHKYQQESKKIGKQSFAFAWVLDETGEERERGITMDVGHSRFETETKQITLLDAPGHKDFIPNMITGATQADVALLVVDATRGEFETGFESGGQTREHALLLRSLGVSQIAVVVNKLDTVNWSKDRFNEIVDKMSAFLKQAGYNKDAVPFVPCSGLSGENIVTKPKEPLSSWYAGPTLVDVIDSFKCPERPVNKPFRFSVHDIFKGTGSGFCVSGHVETGMVAVGDKVLVLPRNETAVVKGLQQNETTATTTTTMSHAFAGDHVALILSGIDQQNVGIGDIVCNPQNPVSVTTRFQAHVVIFAVSMPITKGLPVVLHLQSLVQPAVITRLIAQLHRGSGDTIKKKPRCLPKNSSAVIEVTTQSPVCMELYKDTKQLGRVMLRVQGTTIAAGLVTKIG